ncbi:isochorismate synthase [candidate division KSB1 bacterium]|nr:isochorismate synthase [candidate division KSB1 bacterium]
MSTTVTKKLIIEKLTDFWEKNRNSETTFGKLWRIEVPIPEMDILNWLRKQPYDVKTFWSGRDHRFTMGGIGTADIVTGRNGIDFDRLFLEINRKLNLSHPNLKYYGGIKFDLDQKLDADWKDYNNYLFVIPRFEMIHQDHDTLFAVNFLFSGGDHSENIFKDIIQDISELDFSDVVLNEKLPVNKNSSRIPDKDQWQHRVEQALELIQKEKLQKIVLAGKSVFDFDTKLDPAHLIQKLALTNPSSFHFCFQLAKDRAFLGVTPERLYRRYGMEILSEAIAGTRPRGDEPDDDKRLGEELMQSDKDLREHRWVSDMIRQSLEPLCDNIEIVIREDLLKLPNVQHLQTLFKGTLKESVSDRDIIKCLHPTPAVGGYPGRESLLYISELEAFDRGWYAGPVGWIGRDAAEFAVAIRSGLVTGKTLTLFAGSGIVKGSDPVKEWEENEAKNLNFTKLFQVVDAR